MRRLFLFALVLTCSLGWIAPAAAQNKQKNVVILVADDVGRDLGCYGNSVCKTPNLDALAKRGVCFMNAYATVASCSASRACILSGMQTHQCGQFGHNHNPHHVISHRGVQSIPLLLRRAGYFTGIIGKYHVGPDEVYPFEVKMFKNTGGNRDVVAMADHARDFIKKAGKRPFLLYVGYSDPHRAGKGFGNERFAKDPAEVKYNPKDVIVPFFLPDQPEVRQELAEYYQAATRMDRGCGLIIEALREAGQLDNTLIIFISDNGIPFPGAKTTIYQPGVHLPMIVSSPTQKTRGHENNALVSFVDILPTVVDYTGVKGPTYGQGKGKKKRPQFVLTGKSLLPILDQKDAPDRNTVYCSHQFHEVTMYYPMRSIITRRYKLIENLAHKLDYPFASDLWASKTWQGVLERKSKYLGARPVEEYLHRPRFELYDLKNDPREVKNLADSAEHVEVFNGLLKRMRAWQRRTNDPWTILYDYDLQPSLKKG